jgi:hypothetical protein
MTPQNRLASVPPNVLSGASIPNAITGFARPAQGAPPIRALRGSTAWVGVIVVVLALLVVLLVPLLGGRIP